MLPSVTACGTTSKVGTMSAFNVRLTLGWLGSLDGSVMCFSTWPRGVLMLTVKFNSVFSPGASLSAFSAGTVQPQDGTGFFNSSTASPVLEMMNLPANCDTV